MPLQRPTRKLELVVLLYEGETKFFQILVGILQEYTLAPYLFATVLDYAVRQAIDSNGEDFGFAKDQ